jgi:uncharacterized RDD family membrane protein YckC
MTPLQNGNEEKVLVRASITKRFINYFVDIIVFSILASFLLLLFIPDAAGWINNPEGLNLKDRLLISFLYGLYMSITEAIFKGKTLGKLITQTRAVNLDGTAISSQAAFLRGLCRLVPFEQFSGLGVPCRPWHDRWSRTLVADESRK